MQTQLPKAQWDIVSNTNFEPVRPYQFSAIFVPPQSIANTTLVKSKICLIVQMLTHKYKFRM